MDTTQKVIAEKTLFYDIVNYTYHQNAAVQIDQYCNGVTIVNTGTVAMNANGIPLAAPVAPQLLGESVSFGGNRNEIFYGRLDVAFVAAGGAQCIVSQKVYVKFQQTKPFELE